jgi:RNA polymerase-binding transcription factor DksA
MSAVNHIPDPVDHSALEQRICLALDEEERRLLRAIEERHGLELSERTEEEDVGEIASSGQHPADVASETYEREVDFGLVADFRALLDEVADAKRRLRDGRYGRCERCDRLVDADRLTALPTTRWCRDCAGRLEHEAVWLGAFSADRRGVLGTNEFLADDDEVTNDDAADGPEEAALTVHRQTVPTARRERGRARDSSGGR